MRDPDPVKSDAAFDAVLFDRESALPDLVECYHAAVRDYALRFLAVQLMGFSGSQEAVETLLLALDDPEPMVRAEACRSLEDLRCGSEGVRVALQARQTDIHPTVCIAASEALAALETRSTP